MTPEFHYSPKSVEAEKQKISADVVLFDYGNTLAMNPFPSIVSKIAQETSHIINKSADISVHPKEVVDTWTEVNNTIHYPHASHFSQDEPLVGAALQRLQVPYGELETRVEDISRAYTTALESHWRSDTETQKILRSTFEGLKAKGKRIAILSNDKESGPDDFLEWIGMSDLVETVITSEELGIEKPDPKIFEKTAEMLGTSLDKIVYVGDDPERDIMPTKRLGMAAVQFMPTEESKGKPLFVQYDAEIPVQPDAIIHSLTELVDIIE